MTSFENLRILILDVDSKYTASNTVVYKNNVNDTILQFRLVKNNYYYTIPENAKLEVYVNNVKCSELKIELIDRFKGLFNVFLYSDLFENGDNNQYEVAIKIFEADTDDAVAEIVNKTLYTNIFYSTGTDDLEQYLNTYRYHNTSTEIPKNPNPDFYKAVTDNRVTYIVTEDSQNNSKLITEDSKNK